MDQSQSIYKLKVEIEIEIPPRLTLSFEFCRGLRRIFCGSIVRLVDHRKNRMKAKPIAHEISHCLKAAKVSPIGGIEFQRRSFCRETTCERQLYLSTCRQYNHYRDTRT